MLNTVSCYLSLGDGVHDSDGAEWSQVVTAGMVVHLREPIRAEGKKNKQNQGFVGFKTRLNNF